MRVRVRVRVWVSVWYFFVSNQRRGGGDTVLDSTSPYVCTWWVNIDYADTGIERNSYPLVIVA